jgi:WD40 repeat protein
MLVLDAGRKEALHSVAFSPDGAALVATSEWRACLWPDIAEPNRRLFALAHFMDGMYFAADGRWLFGGSLYLHRYDSARLEHTRAEPWADSTHLKCAVHPTAPLVLLAQSSVAVSEPRVGLWPAGDTRPEAAVWCHPRPVSYFAPMFAPDGETFLRYEFGSGGFVEYRTADGLPSGTVHGVLPTAFALARAPTGDTVAARGSNYTELIALAGSRSRLTGRIRNTSRKHFTGAAFHPNGHLLALTSNDATVKVYDVATRAEVRAFEWKAGRMRSVCFSPDGTLAAAGTDRGQVIVWDADA